MKIGDKVMCIDNIHREQKIQLNKIYTILDISYDIDIKRELLLIDNNKSTERFFKYRFITLKKLRKQKLNKIRELYETL